VWLICQDVNLEERGHAPSKADHVQRPRVFHHRHYRIELNGSLCRCQWRGRSLYAALRRHVATVRGSRTQNALRPQVVWHASDPPQESPHGRAANRDYTCFRGGAQDICTRPFWRDRPLSHQHGQLYQRAERKCTPDARRNESPDRVLHCAEAGRRDDLWW